MFFGSCGHGPEMLGFREEALDPVAAPAGVTVKRRRCGAARDRADDGPGTDLCEVVAQPVAVTGRIRQQGLARPERARHVIGGTPVMGLPGCQLQRDRPATGVGDGMDLGGQTAPRAPHAEGAKLGRTGGAGGLAAPFSRSPRAGERGSRCWPPISRIARIARCRHKPLIRRRMPCPTPPASPIGQSGCNRSYRALALGDVAHGAPVRSCQQMPFGSLQ